MYRRLQSFVQSRSLCVLLACVLALSSVGVCLTFPMQAAYAGSAALMVGHKIEYASWDTNAFTVNGFEAYCGEPFAITPEAGTYETQPLTNTAVAAGLWYGFGGPGFDASLWPQDCPVSSGDDAYRVMTHVALAYLATNNASFAYEKCDQSFKAWCDGALFGSGSICERIRNEGFTLNGASSSVTTLPKGFGAYAMDTGADTQVIYAMSYHPHGTFSLQKASSRPALSDNNECYSLAGARYGVFSDAACTQSTGIITTDASGIGHSSELEVGTYYIKELTPPPGYALNSAVTAVQVNASENGTVHTQDEPQSDPVDVILRKIDDETGEAHPLGGATLAHAEYTVRFYAGQFATAEEAASSSALRRAWTIRTNALGELPLNEESKVSGDELYTDEQGRVVLPLGTVTIEETSAPSGYLLAESVLLANITADGVSASVGTYHEPSHPEQVIRGDFSFVKARETDQQRLANIPFRLTSNTTGESHILVTDENGEVKTASTWNAHTANTNASDAAISEGDSVNEALLDPEAGIWFGTDSPRNDRGALPFDTYLLTELRVSGNEGLELITIPTLTIKRDGYEVGWGTLDDQPTATAVLRTHASDALDGDKAIEATQDATVVDEVHYAGVMPGREYCIEGHLVERSTAMVIVNETGAPIGNEAVFLAEAEEGALDLTFTFDARDYDESDIVVLEELTDIETGEVIAAESNLEDSEQTVHLVAASIVAPPPDERPLIHTAGMTKDASPLSRTGLVQTGDALFLLICCCFAGIVIAGFTILRLRRANRRRRLRASLRTRV